MIRRTLCKKCHDVYYPSLKLEGTVIYTATGICNKCGKRCSVKRYVEE